MSGFGAFGKIAGLGDFFRFGLPRDFVQNWDGWLQQGIAEAERRNGESWAECYNLAPIWRFGLPAGTAGEATMMGVMMPSVDRVGRRFPLTLARAVPSDVPLLALYLESEALFARLEDFALATLTGDISPAQLEEALSELELPVSSAAEVRKFGESPLCQRPGPSGSVGDLAASLVGDQAGDMGFWSTCAMSASQAFAMRGAPDNELFLHLVNPFQQSEACL